MSTDPNIFDFLLDPSEIFTFYKKIGSVLKNDRDIATEHVQGKALLNTLSLLLRTNMILKCDGEYTKLIDCQTYELFYAELFARMRNIFSNEITTIINCDKHYDETKNLFYIYVNDIPLKYMGLAMLMEQIHVFDRINQREYFIGIEEYEQSIVEYSKQKKKKISLEQLKNKIEENEKVGEMAEQFILDYEKRRLGIPKNLLVKRVSDIDVTLGYDIISFSSCQSQQPDRFIEVKAVSKEGFFWSKNEYEIAKLKGEKYYLYLVDLKRIDEPGYTPEMIQNPAESVMRSDDWFVEADSYHIKRI